MSTSPFVYAYPHHVSTYREHVRAFAGATYGLNPSSDYALMMAGLCELEAALAGRALVKAAIFRQPLDPQGYTPSGRYFGTGGALFALDVDDGEYVHTCYLRAPGRKALRDAIKRLYPAAKVGR